MPGGSQTATTYSYENDNDLAALTHNYPGATLDLAFTHTTSAAGQLLSTTTSEPLNRYTPGVPLGTQSYATANPLNQYPSVTPIGGTAATLTYDLNGNLTGDGSGTYTYDATNRLLSIAGFATASYGYDALDRRMSKTTGGSTTRFLHAGSDEIAEYTSAGVLLRRYVPGPGTDERAAMIDSGAASPPATAIKYPHTDRQGSVMAVTSSTGAVTERFSYDGFGRSSSAFSGYPFRYTGQRLDFESGLMFYKARVYSTALGRFLQTDPIGTKDDLNLYAYVGNDPVNKVDPTGEERERHFTSGSVPGGDYCGAYETTNTNWTPVSLLGPGEQWQRFVPVYGSYIWNKEAKLNGDTTGQLASTALGMFEIGTLGAGTLLTAESRVVSGGVSMMGKAFETKMLSRHVEGGMDAAKMLSKGESVHVFNDMATLSRVESEIFARGASTGTVRGFSRYGAYFDQPIGTRVGADGKVTQLFYGEMKVRPNGLYHLEPRTGPAR